MEHVLTTYIRTKIVHKHRLKDLDDYDKVKIYQYELKKFLRGHPDQYGPQIQMLKERGEINFDMEGNFMVIKDGPIDFNLLDLTRKTPRKKMPLTPLHEYMKGQLMYVELDVPGNDVPVYFQAFLKHRHRDLDSFFTVDAFSNRVHTPVVNLKHDLRASIKFHGESVISLDVKQMQPTILAKVLYRAIGKNAFSEAIDGGKDVYELLLEKNTSLKTRDQAKKLLFQLIFGRPKNEIGSMFAGDTAWVDWINDYKSRREPKNPHWKETHTNLAWLLQYSEVQVMTGIWEQLWRKNVPFLTIHDDVLCLAADEVKVYKIMDRELKKHFKKYDVVINR